MAAIDGGEHFVQRLALLQRAKRDANDAADADQYAAETRARVDQIRAEVRAKAMMIS